MYNTISVINKFKPPPAKFVAPPLPEWITKFPKVKPSEYEWDKYIETEFERWVNGYGGLTGRHYAYLTANHIKLVDGSVIRPIWRDGDEMIAFADEESRKSEEDLMIVKRREFGLTSWYGGFEPIYNCLMYPGSDNLLTSADKKRVESMFSQKTMITYSNLPIQKIVIPAKTKRDKDSIEFRDLPILRKTKMGELELGREDKFGNTDSESKVSRIVCIQTSKDMESAKGFENYRAMSVFVDELFLHPYAETVHASAQATISQGFKKAGHMVFGGSCGLDDKATLEDVEALRSGAAMGERLWRDADTKGIKTVFVPGWLCIEKAPKFDKWGKKIHGEYHTFMTNGHSDEKGATEWILRRRDFLDKSKNKDMLRNFIKQYPLTIEEVFESNRSPIFPQEVYDKLKEAQQAINLNPTAVAACKLNRIQITN